MWGNLEDYFAKVWKIIENDTPKLKDVCQLCRQKAPFSDNSGEPYLETHHIIWLSQGGDDSIDNTVALCPNCHRKMHIVNGAEDVENLKFINTTHNVL